MCGRKIEKCNHFVLMQSTPITLLKYVSKAGTMNTKCKYYALGLTYVRNDRHKKLFLFSSVKWWNSLTLEIRTSSSLCIF